jgi:FKBP-type peptidyl-prolyl cis-trans isomerase SlyD
MEVAAERIVSINFSLENDKGELLDSSPSDAPLVYLHGAERILPALEQSLDGKSAGDEFSVTITPDEGFGEHDKTLIVQVPRENFPDGQDLQVGMQFQAQDPDGSDSRILTITVVGEESVTVDANHPLAGMTLTFTGTVNDVRPATPAEIDEGRPL